MKSRHVIKGCLVATLVGLGVNTGLDQVIAAPPIRSDVEDGVQVLTRGPVHEAFAETITFDPQPGIVVPKSPPNAIEELPPDQRPEGDNVAWIPGYSAWDDERNDFLWVSGIWRALPPGRQWVPGYWTESGQGSQWISGYWADAKLNEVRYLPEPPATVEAGPNIAAPSANHTWLPGCWVWHQDRYAWRPGYWAQVQQNWDWIPAHYVWSPRGYVFIDGYYDYSVARRGVLFAPVYFNAGVYSQRGYSYSPSTVINLGLFTAHLFSRPSYQHYYFGDYYAANYNTAGYYPWFSFGSSGYGYDPFYARQRWTNRQDGDWERRVATDFEHRRDNENARPPRTLAAQIARNTNLTTPADKSGVVAVSLAQLAKNQDQSQPFQAMDKDERQKLGQRGQEIQKFRQERQKLEAKSAATSTVDTGKPSDPVSLKLPASPISAKQVATTGTDQAVPKTQDAPKPDLKIEPKARVAGEPKGTPKVTKVAPLLPKAGRTPVAPKVGAPDSPKSQPKPTLQDEPKTAPKSEPKPAVKTEPRPMPKAEPKPAPKVEPQPIPKVEPKPVPKVDPKPEPKDEPKPMPKVDPKPEPKREPKNNPK